MVSTSFYNFTISMKAQEERKYWMKYEDSHS